MEPITKLELQRFLDAQRKDHTFHLPSPRTVARVLLAYPRLTEEATQYLAAHLAPQRRR